jgi:hypothetical protein
MTRTERINSLAQALKCDPEWLELSLYDNGGDFGMGNHSGAWNGNWLCHCFHKQFCTTGAPFLSGGNGTMGQTYDCWMRCGCWSVPYATGGQSAMTNYCGTCCGQGGTGGSGVVKVTFN